MEQSEFDYQCIFYDYNKHTCIIKKDYEGATNCHGNGFNCEQDKLTLIEKAADYKNSSDSANKTVQILKNRIAHLENINA